jgi:tetratricopeptide (TPR) repeat protein
VHAAFAQQSGVSSSNPQVFPVGVVIPKVVTLAEPDQSYALYLPASYSPARRWPIVYVFDPSARGSTPVELMKDGAERYGYIVVGSNNSRNGSWPIESEAAQAMFQDAHARFSIDPRRVYFAGFSGGARVAANIAQVCKCAAGLLLNGAGFQPQPSSSNETPFAVFAAAGTYDFNYPEVIQTGDHLKKFGYPHAFRHFSGPHQWAPTSVMDEALAWFRLEAIKSARENRDESFITAQAAQESARAATLEQSGDLYSAWKEYRQAAETFAGLTDTAALQARVQALENDKAVREGAKREKQEFENQLRLTREIFSGFVALKEDQAKRPEILANVAQQMSDLRIRAEHEKQEEKLRVLKRALGAVTVQAVETGLGLLDQKEVRQARDYFDLGLAAAPDSAWVLSSVAMERAMEGDRKGAIAALRHARMQSTDPAHFVAWMKDEPAFEKLRGTPDFVALLELPPQH